MILRALISARPDGQVILTDDTKGVIEIKTSKTSLPLQEALEGIEIKFLEPIDQDQQNTG